ncbi:ABC transporter permease [Aerobium aerolatum]|uniref:Peptide/nickel transport system permease protein n=1 Tax=Aquamicrobium aerolatum DSM 21857 TaxID=1121003 RepID=A0A1I3SEM9_9HYPH|nr:ABC transporter permease [Aquamicrobium aerolatum]SFJ56432.1 peptide/nickel transport system permease protein [Aquamicrobium aerolatum DSM 21857]
MLRYLSVRIFSSAIVIFGVVSIIFVLARLVGDPVLLMVEPGTTQQDMAEMRTALGLDRPILEQYASFVVGAFHGDFGDSVRQSTPAFDLVMDRLPATLLLTASALGFAVVGALILGILSALYRGSIIDRLANALALFGQSIPNFWLAMMLILFLSSTMRLLPSAGYGTVQHLIMPTLALGLFSLARLTRLVRSELLETLSQDYVRTARAKGVGPVAIVVRHALGNVAIPMITLIAVDFGALMGGAVVTETVFAWPGVGRLMIQAIGQRDFPVIQAGAFVIATLVVVTSLITDLAYALVNPKIRYA